MPESRNRRWSHRAHGSRCAAMARTAFAMLVVLLCAPAGAHAGVSDESRFVFNTFSFLVWGGLVMWMAAGFTMLESGSVRTKNAAVICLKNIGLYAIAGIAYYVIGSLLSHHKSNRVSWLERVGRGSWESRPCNTCRMGVFSKTVTLRIYRIL